MRSPTIQICQTSVLSPAWRPSASRQQMGRGYSFMTPAGRCINSSSHHRTAGNISDRSTQMDTCKGRQLVLRSSMEQQSFTLSSLEATTTLRSQVLAMATAGILVGRITAYGCCSIDSRPVDLECSLISIETTPQPLSNSDTTSTSTQNFTIDSSVTVLAGLQAWSTAISSLGLAIDQDESKYIYYIGNDKALHYVTSQDGLNVGSWSVEDSMDAKYWPLADDTDGEFAVASDPSSYDIRIYYMSGGSMMEVSRTGKDTWAEARSLPTKPTATVSKILATTTSSTISSTATLASNSSRRLAETAALTKSLLNTQTPTTKSTQAAKSTNTQRSGSSPADASGMSDAPSPNSSQTAAATGSAKGHGSGSGLSPAATYGIGIAAGLSTLAIAATWVGCYLARRRNKQKQGEQDEIALAPQQA